MTSAVAIKGDLCAASPAFEAVFEPPSNGATTKRRPQASAACTAVKTENEEATSSVIFRQWVKAFTSAVLSNIVKL